MSKRLSIIDDYVSIYKILTTFEKKEKESTLSREEKNWYDYTLALKDSFERLILEKKINDTAFYSLKSELDLCREQCHKSKNNCNIYLCAEQILALAKNLKRFQCK